MKLPDWIRRGRVPFQAQLESVECGATCLGMVLAYHGHHVPQTELRRACGVSRNGVTARGILDAARRYGLEAKAFKVDCASLGDLPMPAIIHWEFNHFVVLERVSAKGAVITDPAGGRLKISPERLREAFTGIALAFEPGPDFRPRKAVKPSLQRYRAMLRTHLPSLGQVLAASFLLQVAGLVFPVAQQLLVDRVLTPRQEPWLWGIAAAMGLAVVVQSTLTFMRAWVVDTLELSMDFELLTGFLRHLMRLPLGFFLMRKSGDLLQRIESNRAIRDIFSSRSVSALLDSFLLVSYGALMLAYNLRLGLLVVGVACFSLAFRLMVQNYSRSILSAELASAGQTSDALLESLNCLETIKAVGAEGTMTRRWTDRRIDQSNASLRSSYLEMASGLVVGLANTIGTALIYGLAGYEVLEGRMTIGVFSAFLSLRGLFMAPFQSVVSSLGVWQRLKSHLERLDDVLEAEPEVSGTRSPEGLRGAIRLEGVGFSYAPTDAPVLRDISVSIAPGEKVALVGPSGAGKTTLARLLLGMLLPTEGTIRFDGTDLREYDLAQLRNRMGVVLQETFLFNDTARANLALNDPSLPQADLEAAARLACIHETLAAMPQGYDTPLGENGCLLSGGQRQRVSLARALAHHPCVLLLDEATSSLDLATEAEVHRNLAAYGCTRIVIAHRLATVMDADRILVLSEGRIVQEGTYAELYGDKGLFQDLVDSMEAAHG